MPTSVEVWTGKLQSDNPDWRKAAEWLVRTPGTVRDTGLVKKSPYSSRFTQGPTIVPRVAFFIKQRASTPLGLSRGRLAVQSLRSVQGKKPWKFVPDLQGVVETEFIRPIFTGDNVFPFRIGEPLQAVMPVGKDGVLAQADIDLSPGLQSWWSQATGVWEENRATETMTLAQRLDYQRTLTNSRCQHYGLFTTSPVCTSVPLKFGIGAPSWQAACIGQQQKQSRKVTSCAPY